MQKVLMLFTVSREIQDFHLVSSLDVKPEFN